ncbi:Kinesin-4 [Drechslerella dactyloides]|uniref:Kinesin-4 n=1 Tax=Drechslerella dactyloides TaxID=74499 RepID=A0AAD6J6U3_DREDA|nr:Kinesin-4 [Drechslerella dactyloides]
MGIALVVSIEESNPPGDNFRRPATTSFRRPTTSTTPTPQIIIASAGDTKPLYVTASPSSSAAIIAIVTRILSIAIFTTVIATCFSRPEPSTMQSSASSIQVTVRVRPFTIREAAQITKIDDGPTFFGDGNLAGTPKPSLVNKGIRRVIKVVDDQFLIFDPPEENPIARFGQKIIGPRGKQQKDMRFGFDRVFDENATQGEVYEQTTKGLLDSVLDGFNATVFAYGATGCGKTHTISGTKQQPGIIFLTMEELFQRIEELKSEKSIELSMSYLEIYNETIRDLLIPGGSKLGLNLREDSNSSIAVAGLSTHRPLNVQEVMDMIVMGNENRTMSPTEANATSSRSHAVLQVNVVQKNKTAALSEDLFSATLSIIDLAGSERASVTKNRGERLLEGANINRSLLALGNCINALCDPSKKNHIPYRDSKLTRLLKFSLGGNCKTVMIVCVSPSSHHYDETHNTLKYADRAKKIKTKVSRNMINVNRHVSQYVKAIYDLQQEVADLKKRLADSVKEAMEKIKKQQQSRESAMKEGVRRIRAAYDATIDLRKRKLNDLGGIRLIDRRIAVIKAWLFAFEMFFAHSSVMPSESLSNIRVQAEDGIKDLEGKKLWLAQRLQSEPWDRSIDIALKSAIDSLARLDGGAKDEDLDTLNREANLQKTMGERDIMEMLLQDELDTTAIEGLTKAHFEAIAELERIRAMEPEQALVEAPMALFNLVQSCTIATGQVITPNGQIAVPEYVASTPGRKRIASSGYGVSPVKKPNFTAGTTVTGPISEELIVPKSPGRGTPKRKVHTPSKKNVTFKKRVRWREDVVDVEQSDNSLVRKVKRQESELQHHLRRSGSPPPPVPVPPSSLASEAAAIGGIGVSKAKRAGGSGLNGSAAAPSSHAPVEVHVDSDSELMPPPPAPMRASSTTTTSAPPVRRSRMAIGFLSNAAAAAGEGGTNSSTSSPDIGRAGTIDELVAGASGPDVSTTNATAAALGSPLRETNNVGNIINRASRASYAPSNRGAPAHSTSPTAGAGGNHGRVSAAAAPSTATIAESHADSYSSSDEQPAAYRAPRFQPSRLTGSLHIKSALKRNSVANFGPTGVAGGARGRVGGHRASVTASFAAPTASVRARRKSPVRQSSPDGSAAPTIINPKSGSGARRSVKEVSGRALSPRSSGVGVQRSVSGGPRRLTVTGVTGDQLLSALQKEKENLENGGVSGVNVVGLNVSPVRMK